MKWDVQDTAEMNGLNPLGCVLHWVGFQWSLLPSQLPESLQKAGLFVFFYGLNITFLTRKSSLYLCTA